MKIGKLPEPVLIRSVLKEVQHRRPEVLVGPAVGQDCAVLEPAEGDVLVFSSDPITGTIKDIGSHSVHITANDLAASGAEPLGIMVTILLTPETEESQLKEMMRGLESACEQLNIEVMGGHTEITDVVKQPLISITGVGRIRKEEVLTTSAAKPGQDIVITKWIGLEHPLRQRRGKAVGALCLLLWRLQRDSISISPWCRQRLQRPGVYRLCMILQRAVYSARSGRWEAVPAQALTLI